ncbi:uncharacterized protein GGS22DRAFT_165102 [Annulohypoxylon maeteangense]|uniref:uncharacterized protein n=1 Tax=Annulohypoxylon maeteangense TaxID=1927788 RepID=UPI002008D907|nr:uncharacterized protein GGS22DRAFT_165102 [Annulohypoxylon maeteangense]KAI0884197.1 hypothetical protein GGS22DRAFT_165102 [Annulohypoxylon maeteangense]
MWRIFFFSVGFLYGSSMSGWSWLVQNGSRPGLSSPVYSGAPSESIVTCHGITSLGGSPDPLQLLYVPVVKARRGAKVERSGSRSGSDN